MSDTAEVKEKKIEDDNQEEAKAATPENLMMSPEGRRKLKSSMAVTKLSCFHTENCHVLPDRTELLNRLPHGGVVAEIGVAYGDFTTDIVKYNRPSKLHLVDAWSTERYEIGLQNIKEKFGDRIDESIFIHQGLSIERLPEFDDGYFDWVYIDTNHEYQTTLDELLIAEKKVKPGGRIAGHDFCTGNSIKPVPYGVVEAVTKFCYDQGWQYEYLTLECHGHFSFCLKPI